MGAMVNPRHDDNQGNDRVNSKSLRLKFARDTLRNQLLPHVSVKEGDEYKKAFFVGYMTYRLIQAHLGRTQEDDRDYYGKKRLDMAGTLLAHIFRQEFRKVIADMQKLLEKDINRRKF